MKDDRTIFELMSEVQKVFDVAGRVLARRVIEVSHKINQIFSGKKTESSGGGPSVKRQRLRVVETSNSATASEDLHPDDSNVSHETTGEPK